MARNAVRGLRLTREVDYTWVNCVADTEGQWKALGWLVENGLAGEHATCWLSEAGLEVYRVLNSCEVA
jgi:hypothetical protein